MKKPSRAIPEDSDDLRPEYQFDYAASRPNPYAVSLPRASDRFVLCVRSGSFRASLEPRKVYRVLKDPAAEADALLRVVDESGEDYLFPADLFVKIELPVKARVAFSRATSGSGASRPARRSRRPTTRS